MPWQARCAMGEWRRGTRRAQICALPPLQTQNRESEAVSGVIRRRPLVLLRPQPEPFRCCRARGDGALDQPHGEGGVSRSDRDLGRVERWSGRRHVARQQACADARDAGAGGRRTRHRCAVGQRDDGGERADRTSRKTGPGTAHQCRGDPPTGFTTSTTSKPNSSMEPAPRHRSRRCGVAAAGSTGGAGPASGHPGSPHGPGRGRGRPPDRRSGS